MKQMVLKPLKATNPKTLIYSEWAMESQVMAYLNSTKPPVKNYDLTWFGYWVRGTQHWQHYYQQTIKHFIDIGFMKQISPNRWRRLTDIEYI
jgi:hypothetical protein